MRAIPIGRKIILLGTVIMAVVLAVVLAIFWSRDRGLSRAEYRAEYQNNVAILEAADGRRFLGYFVAADKLVCINTYCANDKELDTSRYECSDPIRLDSIRVIYPRIAITDILFPTNYQYIHRFIVFKTTPYDGYVNRAMSGPLVEGVVREDFVLYEINGSKPNAVEIIPVHYNPGSSGGFAPYRWPHCKDENGNDTTVCIQPGFLVAKSYIGKDPDIEERLLSNTLTGILFSLDGGCVGFPAFWTRPDDPIRTIAPDEIHGLFLFNHPLMAEYEKMEHAIYGGH